MKNTLVLILAFLPLIGIGQTSLETQKAKTASIAYLKKHLNNPGSYQPVSWSKLTKTYSTFEESNDVKVLNDSLEYYRKGKNLIDDNIHSIKMASMLTYSKDTTYLKYVGLSQQIDSVITGLKDLITAKEKSFKPKFDGYTIIHSYRARNSYNALVLTNYRFILSPSMKVLHAFDSDEEKREQKELQDKIDELVERSGVNRQ